MYSSLFFLTLVVVSVSCQDENEEITFQCYRIFHDGPDRPRIVLDSEQIIALCPYVKKYLDCEIKDKEFDDGEDGYVEMLQSERSLANDLCDKDSELHKAYAASVDCYISLEEKIPICTNIGYSLYNDYREFISPLQVNDPFQMDQNQTENIESYYMPSCIQVSYVMACFAIEVLEQCGTQAYDLFSQLASRFGEMKLLCSSEENHKLRSTFLEYLETENKHKQIDIISQIFDSRKK